MIGNCNFLNIFRIALGERHYFKHYEALPIGFYTGKKNLFSVFLDFKSFLGKSIYVVAG